MEFRDNVSLKEFTTFEIGGRARYFAKVENEGGMRDALEFAREKNMRFYVIAGGSNILVPDEGLDGLVIKIASKNFTISGTTVHADAGCDLLALIRATAAEGIGGWEKLAGIPGTIGGAVRGNAGAFGPEIKDFVQIVRAINVRTEEVREFSNVECDFSYRNSFFKMNPEWLILDVHFELHQGDTLLIQRGIDEIIAEREKRHIQNVKAAGSFFMNPVAPAKIVAIFEEEKTTKSRGGRVPAGWLIEKAGLKGATVGGAQVSPQQANYIINAHNATAADVRELAKKVKEEVRRQFDVALEEEAVIL